MDVVSTTRLRIGPLPYCFTHYWKCMSKMSPLYLLLNYLSPEFALDQSNAQLNRLAVRKTIHGNVNLPTPFG